MASNRYVGPVLLWPRSRRCLTLSTRARWRRWMAVDDDAVQWLANLGRWADVHKKKHVKVNFCIAYCYDTIIFQYAIVRDRAGVQPRLQPRPTPTGPGLRLTAMPSPNLPFNGRHPRDPSCTKKWQKLTAFAEIVWTEPEEGWCRCRVQLTERCPHICRCTNAALQPDQSAQSQSGCRTSCEAEVTSVWNSVTKQSRYCNS